MGAGTLGVPRRHWDINFADAPFTMDFPAAAHLMMGLNGLTALMGTVGAAIFILNMVGTLLFGRPMGAAKPAAREEPPLVHGPVSHYGGAGTLAVPGTFSLAMLFLVAFVLYYFVNWKYLAGVWGLQ